MSPALSLTLYEHAHEVIELAAQLAEATLEEQAELAPQLCNAIAGTRQKVDRCCGALTMLATAQAAAREEVRSMTPNDRVAVTVALQRAFYRSDDHPRRLPRLLAVLERS